MTTEKQKALEAVRVTFEARSKAATDVRQAKRPASIQAANRRYKEADEAYRVASDERDRVFGERILPKRSGAVVVPIGNHVWREHAVHVTANKGGVLLDIDGGEEWLKDLESQAEDGIEHPSLYLELSREQAQRLGEALCKAARQP